MRYLLWPLALLFSVISNFRRFLYSIHFLKSHKLSKPVVSVGNLTLGGTGKTPFVDLLIGHFESKNCKVGVLTRGYGRKSIEIQEVEVNSKTQDVGDEPLWLKRRHPDAKIIVGANRVEAAKKLADVGVIILDDGFQHFRIQRDFDIVLVDTTMPSNQQMLLPAGRCREGWNALRRADSVVLTKTNLASSERVDEFAEIVFDQGVMDVHESETIFDNCVDLFSNIQMNIEAKKVYLCSAIGNPENFKKTVAERKAVVVGNQDFRDHATPSLSIIQEVVKKAKQCGAEFILITEKDGVKWKEVIQQSQEIPIGIVSTKMVFSPQLPEYYDLVIHNSR